MDTVCIKIKIRNDSLHEVREWFKTLTERSDETIKTLENEKVSIESIFLDEIDGEESFIIYFMKATDLSYAYEIAKKSTAAIDIYHKECKKKFFGEKKQLELLANFDLNDVIRQT